MQSDNATEPYSATRPCAEPTLLGWPAAGALNYGRDIGSEAVPVPSGELADVARLLV